MSKDLNFAFPRGLKPRFYAAFEGAAEAALLQMRFYEVAPDFSRENWMLVQKSKTRKRSHRFRRAEMQLPAYMRRASTGAGLQQS